MTDPPARQPRHVDERTTVCVTGGAGFIGCHIVRAALDRGCAVRAVVEPGTSGDALKGLDVEQVVADVRDPAAVRDAVAGAALVVHTAALYRFWHPEPDRFYQVNVEGTRNVLGAAAANGSRIVYTSTVGTIGLPADGRPATEADWPRIEHLYGHYKRSKYVAEHEALRLAAEGADIVVVQPTFPVGDQDRGPTPTGQTILRFLDGDLPAYVDTVLNVVDVDDVARGHLLAAERGRRGRSYILGGEDFTLRRLVEVLAAHTGLHAPTRTVPGWTATLAGRVSTFVQAGLLHREPTVPLEAALMSSTAMSFDDRRARAELGYTTGPAAGALARAADWFVEEGFVDPSRAALIRANRRPHVP